jgi:hypothetical protein
MVPSGRRAELSRIATSGLRDYESLAEQERVRFIATFMAFLSYSQNAFLKWREGLLESLLWMGWEFVIMNLVCAPGGRAFWKDPAYMFGDEFRRYVESDLMKREPHPEAKPMGAFSIGGGIVAHESHGMKSGNTDS